MAKELTDKERIEKLSREERNKAAFAAVKDALALIDLTKTRHITYTTYYLGIAVCSESCMHGEDPSKPWGRIR